MKSFWFDKNSTIYWKVFDLIKFNSGIRKPDIWIPDSSENWTFHYFNIQMVSHMISRPQIINGTVRPNMSENWSGNQMPFKNHKLDLFPSFEYQTSLVFGSGNLKIKLVWYSNGQKEVRRQIVQLMKAIWIAVKWTPSCFLVYWSGIQMVGQVHSTKHIDWPFEYQTIWNLTFKKFCI